MYAILEVVHVLNQVDSSYKQVGIQSIHKIDGENNRAEEINSIINLKTLKQKINKPIIEYNYKSLGPYEVIIKSMENGKNIGKQCSKYSKKKLIYICLVWKRRKRKILIGVNFNNFKDANKFNKDNPSNNAYIFYSIYKVTCKGVWLVDTNFSSEELKESTYMKINEVDVVDIKRMRSAKSNYHL